MAQQTINVGTAPNDGTGTPLRTAFQYTNSNFSELYTALGGGSGLPGATTQVIFNDGGTNLAGDAGLVYNKTTDALTIGGNVQAASATITGDLTVDTNVLKVDTSLNRVGVVTATPRVSLDVASGDIYSSGQITWGGSSPTANQGFLSFTGGNAVIGSTGATALLFYTNGVERYNIGSTGISTWSVGGSTAMTLNSTGLGVGTTDTTNGRLNVRAGTAATGNSAFFNNSDGTYNPYLQIQHSSAGIKLFVSSAFGTPSNNLIFGNGGVSETMRIDGGGNVGIGVTPSAWSSGLRAINFSTNGVLYANGGNSVFFGNNYYNDAGGTNRYLTNNVATAYGQVSGAHQWFTAPSGTAGNAATFTQAMTLNANGALALQGGNTSANGVGIAFPATQVASSDANTLDDYEEGTFTPSITFGGASVGMTGTFAGRYTKVGRAVTINGIIALTAKGSSTGIAKISGLPFTSANASGEYTAISIRLDRVSFADYPCGYVGPNSSVVELENTTNAGTVSSMTDSNFINTSVVIVNFTYTV